MAATGARLLSLLACVHGNKPPLGACSPTPWALPAAASGSSLETSMPALCTQTCALTSSPPSCWSASVLSTCRSHSPRPAIARSRCTWRSHPAREGRSDVQSESGIDVAKATMREKRHECETVPAPKVAGREEHARGAKWTKQRASRSSRRRPLVGSRHSHGKPRMALCLTVLCIAPVHWRHTWARCMQLQTNKVLPSFPCHAIAYLAPGKRATLSALYSTWAVPAP